MNTNHRLVSIFDGDAATLDLLLRHYAAARGPVIVDVVPVGSDGATQFDLFSVPATPDGLVLGSEDLGTSEIKLDGPLARAVALFGERAINGGSGHATFPTLERRRRTGAERQDEDVISVCREILSDGPATIASVVRQVNAGGWGKSLDEVRAVLENLRAVGALALDGDRWSLVPATTMNPASGARKTAVSVRDISDEQFVAVVRNAGEITLTNISNAIGAAPGSVSYRLDKLVASGALVRDEVSKLYRVGPAANR